MIFQKSFYMFKTLKIFLWTILFYFFTQFFFILNVHHSFLKINIILLLMIKTKKWVEFFEIQFYNTFWCFWFKHVFGFETMDPIFWIYKINV
jgi:hypothetical protein